MLYKKNQCKELDLNLFKNPTSEYRGTPFWAWNCELNKEILTKQIEYLKEMGFGGFHMHSRSGMGTEYLGEDFTELVKVCRDKAVEENMLAWLYDEDRWPSGSAGGYVTKNKKFRMRTLCLTENKEECVSEKDGIENGETYLLCVFDILLNSDGTLKEYRQITENEIPAGIKRYAYIKTQAPTGWYNNSAYVDTLSNEAIAEFINITYEAYKNAVGDSFGEAVPAIFTDEPQFSMKQTLPFATSHNDVSLPWTCDFPDTFEETYGYSISDKIPELFWDLPDSEPSVARYHFHDHICERFTQSFADQCGKWCEEHGIALTGHMMGEDNLTSQTAHLGEAMRSYRSFQIPGIDVLCNFLQLTTAKQAQSTVHQYGREAMLSELYGVTNWDFDFRGHKFQGDWQAATGVTVRVPHLSWVSMKGSAKRDYPASINYQAPWYKQYKYVEDHFARLNTVLTRGKPSVNTAVIHPVESFWLHWGPNDTGSDIRTKLENNFSNISEWLMTGMVDFDFISESLLPSQINKKNGNIYVGEMNYSTIIVPGCETIRQTTLDFLKAFKETGGRVLFVGDCPLYVDAKKSEDIKEFYNKCETCSFEQISILDSLQNEKGLKLIYSNGTSVRNMIHSMRTDGDIQWCFLAHITHPETIDIQRPESLHIIFDGEYTPEIYDTVNGAIYTPEYEIKDGKTYIYKTIYAEDSLLIKLSEKASSQASINESCSETTENIDFRHSIEFERSEDNVYMLDMAEYKLDSDEFKPVEEIIRIDDLCRQILGYPAANGKDAQPWVLGKDIIEHYVTLKFTVNCKIETDTVFVAGEEAESIKINGKEISLIPCGYYVDESIKKYNAGKLISGENIIEIIAPIGKRTSIENYFLLGNFDVTINGCEKTITNASDKIGFGDITTQGMPFYGGNITYKTEINLKEESSVLIRTNRYRGACIKVFADGKDCGYIAYSPYELKIENLSKGTHTIEFVLFGNRVNTFGPLHNCSYSAWFGPDIWYTYRKSLPRYAPCLNDGFAYSPAWTYEYNLKPTGILSSPVIQIMKKIK